MAICQGHTDAVGAIAFSKNRTNYTNKLNYLVTGSNDKILKKWDIPCGAFSEIIDINAKAADTSLGSQVERSEELSTLLTALSSTNTTIDSVTLNHKPPHVILAMNVSLSTHAHDKDITTVDVSPNDTLIATGSQDKTIKLWNSEKLQNMATLKGHKRSVWKVQFSPVDKVLASSSGDRTVKLWSINDYACLVSVAYSLFILLL